MPWHPRTCSAYCPLILTPWPKIHGNNGTLVLVCSPEPNDRQAKYQYGFIGHGWACKPTIRYTSALARFAQCINGFIALPNRLPSSLCPCGCQSAHAFLYWTRFGFNRQFSWCFFIVFAVGVDTKKQPVTGCFDWLLKFKWFLATGQSPVGFPKWKCPR